MLSQEDIASIIVDSLFAFLAIIVTIAFVYALYFKRNQIITPDTTKNLDLRVQNDQVHNEMIKSIV